MADTAVCRCCLAADAPCRTLFDTYVWDGEREVYMDMLLESFDIRLSPSGCGDEVGICESCVIRLRDATSFKRQVLSLEERFKKFIISVKEENNIKVESAELSDELNRSDSDADLEDENEDVKDVAPPSRQTAEPRTAVKRKAAPVRVKMSKKARAKKQADTKLNEKNTIDAIKKGPNVRITLSKTKTVSRKLRIKLTKPMPHALTKLTDRFKRETNVAAVLKYSNMTPFKDRKATGCFCFYCPLVFSDPQMLRQHCRENHQRDRNSYVAKLTDLRCHFKADIEDLQCTICKEKTPDIPTLKRHLTASHGKRTFDDVADQILPFKLTKDAPMYCAICEQQFEAYKILHLHMNVHFRNYICDVCSTGFVTAARLKIHMETHKDRELPCEYCDKTFASTEKLNNHVKGVHMGQWKSYVCPECGERFVGYRKRQIHLVEVHNATPIEYACKSCDKTFSARTKLTIHTRRFHLLQKDWPCEFCDMKFFSNQQLRDHMVTHKKETFYQCEVCSKSYARKKTLREHMRIHLNDRRFECAACSQTFVQKCSWRGHVNSQHSEFDPEDLLIINSSVPFVKV